MRAVKYLFALWAGVLLYAALAVLFGPNGLSAYRQLDREREKQEIHIENLKLINQELENTKNSLLYDKDTLSVYAREQGYALKQERFVRIVGLGGKQKIRTSPGELVGVAPPQYTPDWILRIIAFCGGITIFICMAVYDFTRFLSARHEPTGNHG